MYYNFVAYLLDIRRLLKIFVVNLGAHLHLISYQLILIRYGANTVVPDQIDHP